MIDNNLFQFATDRQAEYLRALEAEGSHRKAAAAMGVTKNAVSYAIASIKKKAALQGYSPDHDMVHTVPNGYYVKGVSTYYKDGEATGQWVKTDRAKEDQRQAFEEFVTELAEPLKGIADPVSRPVTTSTNLSAYIIGDAHIGMYAWDEETGNNFDSDIAIQQIHESIDTLVQAAMPTEKALLVNLGDFLHIDNSTNMTPASGNRLDADSRYSRVIRLAAYSLRHCIQRLLERHGHVEVINARGNHDPHSSLFLSNTLEMFYEREKRVSVQPNIAKFNYYTFGDNLIGVTHGDKIKLDLLPSIMADDQAAAWGITTNRFWWTGHIHQKKVQEYRGCVVESFNTLAPPDAWHVESGYKSRRSMTMKTLHPEKGVIAESFFNIVR